MTTRTATWLGGSLAILCVVAHVVAAILLRSASQTWDPGFLLMLGFQFIGVVIVSQQPRNTIGWLLVVCGTLISLGLLFSAIVRNTLGAEPETWQGVLAWVANIAFIGAFEGLIIAMAFLFPTGKALSPRWRLAGITVAVLFVGWFFIASFRTGPVDGIFGDIPEIPNPFGMTAVDTFSDAIAFLGLPVTIITIVVSLAAVVTRVRRSQGIERLQLQWISLALSLIAISLTLQVFGATLLPDPIAGPVVTVAENVFFPAGTLGVSLAIGIAILRYRLYDIERLVNRSIVYLTLTVSLVVIYLGLVLLLGNLLRSLTGGSSGIVTAISTLTAAALFNPLRRGIHRVVDQRFYRRKYDAAQMVETFAERLRDEVDLEALSVDLQSVVVETMQPSHVSLWLRPRQ